jgi:hypothetical protein
MRKKNVIGRFECKKSHTDLFVDCGRPPVPSNALASYTLTEFGSNATFACEDGYNLVGNHLMYCLPNGWNGSVTCQIKGIL